MVEVGELSGEGIVSLRPATYLELIKGVFRQRLFPAQARYSG